MEGGKKQVIFELNAASAISRKRDND